MILTGDFLFQLIQFLVTLVQPSNPRIGVGMKRRMPLMLHESSPRKLRETKHTIQDNINSGPTIHELDNEIEILPDELFDQDDEQGLVN